MKTLSLSLTALFITAASCIHAQTYDVVSIGAGYSNQTFYSMANGEVSSVSNTDWDLAFQISGFQAAILVNGKNNVKLFRSGLDVNAWTTITANDTVGMMNSGNELLNQDTSWWSGAFNITADLANPFDLGWGVYDMATHVVLGDSLYFIKLSNGVVKKLWIQALQNSTYYFQYADLDGTNEVTSSLSKTAFAGKNFGYYSILNNVSLDREPNKYTWDLTFMQYMATTPYVYKVTGVLSNDSVTVAKAYPVDVASTPFWGQTYSHYINTIGFNWKSYSMSLNQWLIEDSLVYFVYDRSGGLWKLYFSAFGGSATGDYEFYKEQVSATGIEENGGKPALLSLYPNPATDQVRLNLFVEESRSSNHLRILDVNGRQVMEMNLSDVSGLKEVTINTGTLSNGVYLVQLQIDGGLTVSKLVVSR